MGNDATQEQVAYPRLTRICALLAVLSGFTALLGWGLKVPFLASLGAGRIPMAPSTALLFILFGSAVFLRTSVSLRGSAHWTILAVPLAGTVISLLLLILSSRGKYFDAERLGFSEIVSLAEVPVGHMSPVTAVCFLLSSLSFLASLSPGPDKSWRNLLARGLAGVLIATCLVLLLAYLYGSPLFYVGSFIPPAATTSIAFVALGTAMMALTAPRSRTTREQPEADTRISYALILVFVLLSAGIVSTGYVYYRNYEERFRAAVENQLSAVAELKVGEITQWRKDRLGDGVVLQGNANFSRLVQRYLKTPEDSEAEGLLRAWLGQVHAAYHYNRVSLLDGSGANRMSVPEGLTPRASLVTKRVEEVLQTGQVAIEDFYRNEHDKQIYLTILIPIFDAQERGHAIGVLSMRIDTEQYLYPLIERWPIPSDTAETLFVRRDGNEAVILNELRFQNDAALSLRFSLEHVEIPAVQAALGRVGIIEGVDYRGVPVIAYVCGVPDSPWFLETKIDVSEVYAPLRERLWMMIAFVVALLLGAGVGVGSIWRQQQLRFYRGRYEAAEVLRDSEAKLQTIIENLAEGLIVSDLNGQVTYFNRVAVALHGFNSRDEWHRHLTKFADTFELSGMDGSVWPVEQWPLARILRGEDVSDLEARIRRIHADWERIFIYGGTLVHDAGGTPMLAIVTMFDITERKRAGEELARYRERLEDLVQERTEALRSSEDRFRTLFNTIDEGFCIIEMIFDEQEKPVDYCFLEVNPAFEKQTGLHGVQGKRMRELAPQHEEHWFETYGRIAVTGEPARFQNRAEQLHRWFDVYANRMGEPKKRQVAILFNDITERKEAEANIAQLNADLLLRSTALEVANKELEAFSYSVSHDLRSPLRGIDGWSLALLEDYNDQLDDQAREYLNRVRTETQRMGQLIDDMLQLSRVARADMQTRPVNLSAIAQVVSARLLESEPERKVEFILQPELKTLGDARLLEVVLTNLLSNAFKFTSKRNDARIEFGTTNGQGEPAFFVRDNGAGFDMAYATKLFGAFQRMHKASDFPGTGVGLAIVQRIIHRHGGRIWSEAKQNEGATFYFTLMEAS